MVPPFITIRTCFTGIRSNKTKLPLMHSARLGVFLLSKVFTTGVEGHIHCNGRICPEPSMKKSFSGMRFFQDSFTNLSQQPLNVKIRPSHQYILRYVYFI